MSAKHTNATHIQITSVPVIIKHNSEHFTAVDLLLRETCLNPTFKNFPQSDHLIDFFMNTSLPIQYRWQCSMWHSHGLINESDL